VEALRKKERQDETQFTTKIDGFLSFIPRWMLIYFFADSFWISPCVWPNSGFWCCVFLTLRISYIITTVCLSVRPTTVPRFNWRGGTGPDSRTVPHFNGPAERWRERTGREGVWREVFFFLFPSFFLGPPSFSWGWLEWRSHRFPTLVNSNYSNIVEAFDIFKKLSFKKSPGLRALV
jgi:hypothetical protein